MPNPVHPYLVLTDICKKYDATLVAVSKTRTKDEIDVLYRMGQRVFAENRAQELLEKAPVMPKDIEWHLIGHLQTNKVKSILTYVTCIQSLDSEKLWDKIQDESAKLGKTITCLLQIKIASEETKYGWSYGGLVEILENGKHLACPNIKVGGVMGMASLTDDTKQIRREMRQLRTYYEALQAKYFSDDSSFTIVSMGMSGDYQIALEEGSSMIRIGSLLFRA